MGQVMQEELVTWLSGLARLLLSHATVVRFSCGSKYCETEDPSLVSESMLGDITHPSAETVWSEFSDNFNPFFGRLVFRGAVHCTTCSLLVSGRCYEALGKLFSDGSLSLRADHRGSQNYRVPALG
ncbi:hypothetical protein IGI04_029033 [Brassica rapa subsp. trilocularis]|uniref:Uncharacterized protein n=1 Tax=Brassica rapa subsp. trilocularis TaxID=1813537 RepID=A0ABQ7L606_BRACM|nr:hypothetical protein IGI04_029033 [Brassica rapa subsp. trilocularis]